MEIEEFSLATLMRGDGLCVRGVGSGFGSAVCRSAAEDFGRPFRLGSLGLSGLLAAACRSQTRAAASGIVGLLGGFLARSLAFIGALIGGFLRLVGTILVTSMGAGAEGGA